VLFGGKIRDFVNVVKEYKKFFVPKYCSTPTFYLGLIFMLLLPRRLFKLPGEQRTQRDNDYAKYIINNLTDKDKQMLREVMAESLGNGQQRKA